MVLYVLAMNNWTTQIFLAVIIIFGISSFMLLTAERNGPKEQVVILKNNTDRLFALQILSVQKTDTDEEVRYLNLPCQSIEAHFPDWKNAIKLSPGQSKSLVWDGLTAGCKVAPRVNYKLVAVDMGPDFNYMNPATLVAGFSPK